MMLVESLTFLLSVSNLDNVFILNLEDWDVLIEYFLNRRKEYLMFGGRPHVQILDSFTFTRSVFKAMNIHQLNILVMTWSLNHSNFNIQSNDLVVLNNDR